MDKEFFRYLYTEQNVPDVLDKYCAPMLSSPNPLIRLKAARLLNYWGLLTDPAFFKKRLQDVFHTLYASINDIYPDLPYELSGRIKGLISTVNKLDEIEENTMRNLELEFFKKKFPFTNEERFSAYFNTLNRDKKLQSEFCEFLLEQDFESSHEKNPFNRVCDFFAFRIVIEDEGNGDSIDELYDIANIMISFFNSNTFQVMPSYPLMQTGKLAVNSDLIFIPKESGIKPEYRNLCKDYVMYPKKDGYQSIHFVVHDPYTTRQFEVQLRTRSMDIIAETLANHKQYKKSKYGKQQRAMEELIDFSKINIKGFRYFKYYDRETGEEKTFISDRAGITQAIPIKLEIEHFLTKF